MGLVVAKVGGSLFELPDLRDRLRRWADTTGATVMLVPGGGAGADVIRRIDRVHAIGEPRAHWLALRVLSVNAHFLAGLLGTQVVPSITRNGPTLGVLDPHAFCLADEGQPGALPHTWRATSDAVAARVAEIESALVVLLKSTDLPAGLTWEGAAAAGLVDETFAAVVARAGLSAKWVNLRSPENLAR